MQRPKESRTERLLREEPLRRDADEVRKLGLRVAEFLRDERPDARVLNTGSAGELPGPHEVGAAGVVAFLGGHPAEDREPVAVPGDLRQVLADLETGRRRRDFLVWPAVLVAGLQVPQITCPPGTCSRPGWSSRSTR